MPDRPRRTGARRGALSPELRQAVRDEAARLAEERDPVIVTKNVGDFFVAIDRELERVAKSPGSGGRDARTRLVLRPQLS